MTNTKYIKRSPMIGAAKILVMSTKTCLEWPDVFPLWMSGPQDDTNGHE